MAVAEETDCPPRPARFVAGSPASRRPRLVRRYVGTVGGQPATALLEWQHPASVTGTFYLHRGTVTYSLESSLARHGQIVLGVYQENLDFRQQGEWLLRGRLGSDLAGTWHTPTKTQPVQLRESYAGAVRLGIQTLHLQGGPSLVPRQDDANCEFVPRLSHDFWQLLAPLAVPAALRRQLSPPLAARRRLMLSRLEGDGTAEYSLHVRLNDFGLLSYETINTSDPMGGRPGYATTGSPLIDLTGGRQWPVRRLFQPNFELPLRRLITWHLLHDGQFADMGSEWKWAEKPASRHAADTAFSNSLWLLRDLAPRPEAYVFTSEGLELTYWHGSLVAFGGGSLHDVVLVPYRELRPLVRPGTPLARMLLARGMW